MRDLLVASTRRRALTSILGVLASSHDGFFSRQALAAPSGSLASQVAKENAQRFDQTTPVVVEPFVFEGSEERQLVASVDIPIYTRVASYPVEVLLADDDRVRRSSNYALAIYEEDKFGSTKSEFLGIRGIPTWRSMTHAHIDGLPAAGMYSNEPNESERPNCVLLFPQAQRQPKVGEIVSGYLLTTRRVRKGETLTWCYGDVFRRNYKTWCDSSSG